MVKSLLVIGPGSLPDDWRDNLAGLLEGHDSPDSRLDLLVFRDDADNSIASFIGSVWNGSIQELSGAEYLARIDDAVNESISQFVADLRERLAAIALSTSGKRWAGRFGRLWWKTVISEKNSPADDMWWQLFRAAAIRERLGEESYSRCIIIGDNWFVGLGEQAVVQAGVPCESVSVRSNTFSLARVLLTRLAGGIFYFFAAVMAKRHERARGVDFDNAEQSPYLIHTFFPKMWTDRFGSWKDMYYGTLPQLLKDETDTEPVYALRAYDSTAFVPPAVYKDRLKLLDTPGKTPGRYMLLESFASSGEIVRAYLSPGDAINYFRMTLHPEFDRTFIWEGLDASELFKDRLWRSALVYWPNLQVLEQSVKRLTERLRPEVVASYCFEFIFGRAIISGTREGAPTAKVTGLQHGPVSPMKMLYSGVESERMCLTSSADALTEPDVYSVDGAIAARILENRGIPPSMIKTPGAARFDDVWDEIRRSRGTSKPREKLRVLVAPGLHDTPFLLGAALKALSNDNRLELVLKPHPKVPSDYVSRLVDSYTNSRQGDGAEVTLVKTGSIYEWMAESDIFLATYSSVGVEAIAFGLPVIMMLPNSTPDMSLYHSHHVPVLKASSADELREHVNKLASNPDFVSEYVSQLTDVLHDSFGPTDSQASQRLAKLCADIRNSHNATEGVEIPSNKIPTVAG